MQHDNQFGSDHFPQLAIQELTTMHSNELGLHFPYTSFSLTRPTSDHSAPGNPSPPEGPSPPMSPVPGYAFTANTLATSLSEAVGDHHDQSTGLFAAPLAGFSLTPAPACPLTKERLECDATKGYGVNVQGEFIHMPAPPASIAVHAQSLSATAPPAMYTYPATESGPSTPGDNQLPAFSIGYPPQQPPLGSLAVPPMPALAMPGPGPQMPLSVADGSDMYAHYAAHAQASSTSGNDEDSDHDDETGLTPHEVKRRRLRRKAELARMSRLSKKNRLSELEAENAMLRAQLALAQQRQAQANAGVDLSSLQSALQAISDSVSPALHMLAARGPVPMYLNPTVQSTYPQQVQPQNAYGVTQTQHSAPVPSHPPSEIMTRRRRASPL